MANKAGSFLFGLLFGALVGSAAAILTAPQNGEAVREQIRSGLDEIKLNYDRGAQQRRAELEDEIRHLRGEA